MLPNIPHQGDTLQGHIKGDLSEEQLLKFKSELIQEEDKKFTYNYVGNDT